MELILSLLKTIGIEELAEILGCSKSSIYNKRALIAAGKLSADALPPSISEPGSKGDARYILSSVYEWLKKQEATSIQKLAEVKPPRPRGRPRKEVDPVGRISA